MNIPMTNPTDSQDLVIKESYFKIIVLPGPIKKILKYIYTFRATVTGNLLLTSPQE